MRKLKFQVQMSVDGFMGGPKGELDWMQWNWDDKLKVYVNELTGTIDTILLGRKMAGGFIEHWTKATKTPDSPEYEFGKIMVDTPKIVFTRTLVQSDWENTKLAGKNFVEEINNLKKERGKDIMVYGGSTFVTSLVKEGLIDEYYLFVNPVAIGKGITIFAGIDKKLQLKLIDNVGFDCGVTLLKYAPA